MEISEAQNEDIEQLIRLLYSLFNQEKDFVPEQDKQRAGLEAIINNAHVGKILIAKKGEVIIGMVNLLFTISTSEGTKVALLEDMVIDESFRGSGLGSELLDQAILIAKANGCARITLLTDHDNTRAINFYKNKGFVTSAMIPLRLNLND